MCVLHNDFGATIIFVRKNFIFDLDKKLGFDQVTDVFCGKFIDLYGIWIY